MIEEQSDTFEMASPVTTASISVEGLSLAQSNNCGGNEALGKIL